MNRIDIPIQDGDKFLDVKMQKIRAVAQTYISKHELNAVADVVLDTQVEGVVLRVKAFVWGSVNSEIKYPATWWQHVKERWYPKSWLKRWPVKHTTYEAVQLYPQLQLIKDKPFGEVKMMIRHKFEEVSDER